MVAFSLRPPLPQSTVAERTSKVQAAAAQGEHGHNGNSEEWFHDSRSSVVDNQPCIPCLDSALLLFLEQDLNRGIHFTNRLKTCNFFLETSAKC